MHPKGHYSIHCMAVLGEFLCHICTVPVVTWSTRTTEMWQNLSLLLCSDLKIQSYFKPSGFLFLKYLNMLNHTIVKVIFIQQPVNNKAVRKCSKERLNWFSVWRHHACYIVLDLITYGHIDPYIYPYTRHLMESGCGYKHWSLTLLLLMISICRIDCIIPGKYRKNGNGHRHTSLTNLYILSVGFS